MKRFISTLVAAICLLGAYAAPYAVTASTLNLRTAPSKDAAVAAALPKGSVVEVTGTDGEWATVSHDGHRYYAAAKYLTAAGSPGPDVKPAKGSGAGKILTVLPYNDLSSRLVHNSDIPLYVCIGLLVCFSLINIFGGTDAFDEAWSFYTASALFLLLCLAEIYHFAGYQGNPIWFCLPSTVGWLWTVVNFLLFGYFCYVQIMTLVVLSSVGHAHGERVCNNTIGFILTLVAIAAFLVCCFFFQDYAEIALVADGVALAGWIGWMVYCNVRDRGSWLNLLLVCALWTIGMASTILVLAHYIVMLLLVVCAVIAGYIVLQMIGNGSSSSSSSSSSTSMVNPSPSCETEERHFLKGEDGSEIEVEMDCFGNAHEKGAIMGRRFRKNHNGDFVEY